MSGRAFQVVIEDPPVQLDNALTPVGENAEPAWTVGGAAATRFSKIHTKARDLLVDIVRLFDPGWRKPVRAQQMMSHPQAWVFKRSAVERYGLAVPRKIIELAGLECFPDFS